MVLFHGEGSVGVPLCGWRHGSFLFDLLQIAEGRLLANDDKQGVMLGSVLAENLNMHSGDAMEIEGDFVTTTPFESKLFPGTKMQTIEVGVNAFPDQAPGLTLPITPDWVEITAAEAAGTK